MALAVLDELSQVDAVLDVQTCILNLLLIRCGTCFLHVYCGLRTLLLRGCGQDLTTVTRSVVHNNERRWEQFRAAATFLVFASLLLAACDYGGETSTATAYLTTFTSETLV